MNEGDAIPADRETAEGLIAGVAFTYPDQRDALIDAIARALTRRYWNGYDSSVRRAPDARESASGWTSWIDHASVRDSNKGEELEP